MPTYSFRNNTDQVEFDEWFNTNSQKEEFLANNPHIEQILTKMTIIDPHALGRTKPSGILKDRFEQIKRSHYGSTIDSGNLSAI